MFCGQAVFYTSALTSSSSMNTLTLLLTIVRQIIAIYHAKFARLLQT
jgi:hypothetical protein